MKIKIEFYRGGENWRVQRVRDKWKNCFFYDFFAFQPWNSKKYSRDFDKYLIYYRKMNCRSIFRVSGRWLSTIVHMQTHKGIAFSLRMHGAQPSVRPECCHYRHDYAYSDKQSTPLRCRARVAQPETWI